MPVNKRYFSDLMKDRKVSLREVARRMEVWPAALSRSLDDKRKMQMEEAVQLARILSVPLAEVLVNAGIEQAVVTSRRCSIIGHVHEGAEVEPLAPDVIERVSIPDGIADDVVAIQNHTSETPAAYADGWITYLGPKWTRRTAWACIRWWRLRVVAGCWERYAVAIHRGRLTSSSPCATS